MSVHAAGLVEPAESYIWEDLSARQFSDGAARDFPKQKITSALQEYAIAGTKHLDHLASLESSSIYTPEIELAATQLAQACGISVADTKQKLRRLLGNHRREWKAFLEDIDDGSFLKQWIGI